MATDFSSKELANIYSERVLAEELCLRPQNLRIVGNIKGKVILDLGCGDGRYSTIFAKKGAKVIALDASEHQIDIARRVNGHTNISYSVHESVTLSSVIKKNSIDLVFMNMVLPDLDNKKKLEKTFIQILMVLRRKGRLVFSTLHPLYLSPDQDDFDKAVDFNPENYFNEGSTYRAKAITKKGNVVNFNETHFSLTYVFRLLKKYGFMVTGLIESQSIPKQKMFLPKYLIVECIKK